MNYSDASRSDGATRAHRRPAVVTPTVRERRAPLRGRATHDYRRILETERWKLMLALENTEAVEVPMVADSMDSSSLEHERHVALDTFGRKATLLAEVNAALERIRTRTYGLCGECEEPISAGRLNALPWARLCLKCQEEQEIAKQFGDETSLRAGPLDAA